MFEPLVVGINSAYHESSAALLRGSEVLFAVEEERLTRVKHAKFSRVDNPDQLPWESIQACLKAGGLRMTDLDAVAYSLVPGLRPVGLDPYPIDEAAGWGTQGGEAEFDRRVRSIPEQFPGVAFQYVPHHLAHAASAWFSCPFPEAALMVVDGIGERSTAWLGQANGSGMDVLEEVSYPNSLGFLWERVAVYLGFTPYDAPKVMGLAAYGDPVHGRQTMDRLFQVDRETFVVDSTLAGFRSAGLTGLEPLFGPARRFDQDPTHPRFADLAAALQERTEEALLALANRLHSITGRDRLAYAGGVALNCVANGRLEREGPFREIYIPSAAHDAGTALGAAQWVASQLSRGHWPRAERSLTPFLGPVSSSVEIRAALCEAGLRVEELNCPAGEAARRLARGELVGWFQAGLEFGPRALGHRSLLAHPGIPDMRDRLNQRIKHREAFRPFAASVLEERVEEWFEVPNDRPGAASCRDLMLVAYSVRPGQKSRIPAVIHCDGSCRIQAVQHWRDPLLHRLLEEFQKLTGLPLVLNTSFNDTEPIVCTPAEAIATFLRTGLDALVLGNFLVARAEHG